jgi:IS30 family transposase
MNDEELKDLQWKINNKPRKRLKFMTSIEVMKFMSFLIEDKIVSSPAG